MSKKDQEPKQKLKVKTVQFAVGIDLLGSKMTLSAARNNTLFETDDEIPGIIAISKSAKRIVKVPAPNCKGIEYIYDDELVKKLFPEAFEDKSLK